MPTTDITIPVPSERVPEFYRWFADWVENPNRELTSTLNQTVNEAPTGDAATRWWKSLKVRERQIFGLWIDAAPKLMSAEQIVEAMGLNGPRDIPGILSWPTRKGDKVGFKVRWNFQRDPVTGAPLYGIEDVAYAERLGAARDMAEGA